MTGLAIFLAAVWGIGTVLVAIDAGLDWYDEPWTHTRRGAAVRFATAPLWPIKLARTIRTILREAGDARD